MVSIRCLRTVGEFSCWKSRPVGVVTSKIARRQAKAPTTPLGDMGFKPECQFARLVNEHIRRIYQKSFRLETPGNAATADPGIARGLDIDGAIADHPGLGGRGATVFQQSRNADGV